MIIKQWSILFSIYITVVDIQNIYRVIDTITFTHMNNTEGDIDLLKFTPTFAIFLRTDATLVCCLIQSAPITSATRQKGDFRETLRELLTL